MPIQRVVTFSGTGRDAYGMPDPFYRYVIFEAPAPGPDASHYIASIVPLTEPAPLPARRHYYSTHGMNSAALLALELLRACPELRNLHCNEA